MTTGSVPRFRRGVVRRAFDRMATAFTGHDFLYREMARRMTERLEMVRIAPLCILDAGCALGADRLALTERYPEALWLGIDHSVRMLQEGVKIDRATSGFLQRLLSPMRQAKALRVGGTLDALPLAAQQVDLVWSNAALHWLDALPDALKEFNRVLRVGGLLMFSLFGPDTLKELRRAIQAAGYDASDRVHTFIDMHDVGDMLVHGGFSDPVMDMETLTLTYADPWQALRELKQAGSCAAQPDAISGLTTSRFWSRVIDHWPRNSEGRYVLTFELVQGHAWKTATRTHEDGRSVINFMPRPK